MRQPNAVRCRHIKCLNSNALIWRKLFHNVKCYWMLIQYAAWHRNPMWLFTQATTLLSIWKYSPQSLDSIQLLWLSFPCECILANIARVSYCHTSPHLSFVHTSTTVPAASTVFPNRCAIILLLLRHEHPPPQSVPSVAIREGTYVHTVRCGPDPLLNLVIHWYTSPYAFAAKPLAGSPLNPFPLEISRCISSAPAVAWFHSSPNTIVMHYRWTPYRCMAGFCCVAAPRCTYCLPCLLVCWGIYLLVCVSVVERCK